MGSIVVAKNHPAARPTIASNTAIHIQRFAFRYIDFMANSFRFNGFLPFGYSASTVSFSFKPSFISIRLPLTIPIVTGTVSYWSSLNTATVVSPFVFPIQRLGTARTSVFSTVMLVDTFMPGLILGMAVLNAMYS